MVLKEITAMKIEISCVGLVDYFSIHRDGPYFVAFHHGIYIRVSFEAQNVEHKYFQLVENIGR